jgi:ABC-type uncharacterized transport system permease subunit
MKILLRIVAVVFVLIAALLVGIVIAVGLDPDRDLRVPVAVLYVAIGAVLVFLAQWLWRRPGRASADPAV